MNKLIPIFEPTFFGNEKNYLIDCIDTGWISSQGKYVRNFEQVFAQYCSHKYGVAVSNCTTALHLALLAAGVGPNHEVICTNLTFIAPVNMIKVVGANPVLVDCDPVSWSMNLDQVRTAINHKTKAIIVVHPFGHSAQMDEIMKMAKEHNLIVIEDVAEAIGGEFKNKILGSIGHMSCFSFFGNKIITCGEGGLVLTSDEKLKNELEILRDHGMSKEKKYYHTHVGFNFRMTNMQAAIGLAQFEKLDEILKIRQRQEDLYNTYFNNNLYFITRPKEAWCKTVHWLYTLTLKIPNIRDAFIQKAKEKNIELRPMIFPCHFAVPYKDNYNDRSFPVSVEISLNSFHLPSSASLADSEISYISQTLKELIKEFYK